MTCNRLVGFPQRLVPIAIRCMAMTGKRMEPHCEYQPLSVSVAHKTVLNDGGNTHRGSSTTTSTFGSRSTNSALKNRNKHEVRGYNGLLAELGDTWELEHYLQKVQEHQWVQQGLEDQHHL